MKKPNKITTQGYLIKRLKDSGYEVWKIFDGYPETDPRKFTILIDPKHSAIFCTCYENLNELDEECFELHDGGQYIPFRYRLKTDSFEVLLDHLNKHGITHKYENPS